MRMKKEKYIISIKEDVEAFIQISKMQKAKIIVIIYCIILFISNFPVSEEIEICRIGGKQHICGKGKDNSGYIDNINVEYYTSCATLSKSEGYSCVCVQITTSGILDDKLDGYNDVDVQTYDENYLTYQNDPEDPPLDLEVFYKCYGYKWVIKWW